MGDPAHAPDECARFDPAEFEDELQHAWSNRMVGTSLWFENDHVRVFTVELSPGARCPFHCHARPYFWTVVDGGQGLQRSSDGTYAVREYEVGQTNFLGTSEDAPLIHDLENVGSTTLRFVTVELLH